MNALHYLHTDLQLAHGDVKPGNIGRRGRDYLLLDFGMCRPVNELLREASARGQQAELVFVDATELPEAYKLVGRYRLKGEQIELTHRSFSRDTFARGAIRGARFLAQKAPGLYQMSDVLAE